MSDDSAATTGDSARRAGDPASTSGDPASTGGEPAGPRRTYEERVGRFKVGEARAEERSRRVSVARVAAFVAIFGAWLWAELAPGPVPIALAIAAVLAFVALIALHQRIRDTRSWLSDLRTVNEEGLARLRRDWAALPAGRAPAAAEGHAYAADLDLFGHASLVQLLGPRCSPFGQRLVHRWLLGPAPPAEVAERQAAVAELASVNDLRDALAVHGARLSAVSEEEIRSFLAWAESGPWLRRRPLILWSARVLPVLTLALALADFLGLLGPPLWLLGFAAAIWLTARPGTAARGAFKRAFSREGVFDHLPGLFEVAAEVEGEAQRLRSIRARLEGAAPAMRRLRGLMQLADLRYSAMMYVPVQLLTLWDFHVLWRLERWQADVGHRARDWLASAAELEALASLAVLAHDHPSWSFPSFLDPDDERSLSAVALGHPLIQDAARVSNDVEVGPPGSFLLVTGSNMSGKSTLLRAIGVNVVLAHAGAPVCAARLRLPPVELFTTIRVQDSLARGVSYFMAELERLKEVLDAAARASREERAFLYLLDEILQGTNTAERQIAARRIIGRLVELGAIGAVTTHDLTLAAGGELADSAIPVHFEETVERDGSRTAMSFDYRLRPGLATSTNALRLMDIVGLSGERHGDLR